MPDYGIFFRMTGAVERLDRLERLRGLLAGGDHRIAADLAEALGVSRRTLMRDLDLLRAEGAAIESGRGRGGGLRLARGGRTGRVAFRADEAVSVLLSLAIAEKLHAAILGPGVARARQKIAAVFGGPDLTRLSSLRRRILIGAPASVRVAASYDAVAARHGAVIREAFIDLRLLEIVYRDERGAKTERRVEAQYFYLNPPAWYLLAWDGLRDGVRAFRFDRIGQARLLDARFRLRPSAPFLAAAEAGVERL